MIPTDTDARFRGSTMEEGMSALLPVSSRELAGGTLTGEDIRKIQNKLWSLLGERTERYTMGDSTSVTIETAEELLKSICFTIALCPGARGSLPSLFLETEDIQTLLKAGWLELEARMEAGKNLFREVVRSAPRIDSLSYRDTLAGIGTFFEKYDYRFFAHRIPCEIDYQLCHAVPDELQGIEYINEYLKRLFTENRFCNCFEGGTVVSLLKRCCPDYERLLINLFEPVAINVIGLAISGGELASLNITTYDRRKLEDYFRASSKADATGELRAAADQVCSELGIGDAFSKEYLRRTAADLYPRIAAALPAGGLDGIFPSPVLP